MTRDQFIQQLDELKSRGRSVLFSGFILILLAEFPLVLYFFNVQRAEPHSRSTVYLGLATFGACSLIWVAFLVILRHLTAKYSPVCPSCAKRITWRERPNVLSSGHCPRCKAAIFAPL